MIYVGIVIACYVTALFIGGAWVKYEAFTLPSIALSFIGTALMMLGGYLMFG